MGTRWAILTLLAVTLGVVIAENKSAYAQAADNFLDELSGKDVEAVKLPEEKSEHAGHDHGEHGGHEGHGDHGAHGAHGGHEGHMMKMWFHGGFEEVILFDFWRTDSLFGMILSCAAIFIMGATYEGVKWFRVFLQMNQSQSQILANKSCVETTRSSGHQSVSRSHSNKPQSEPFLAATVTRSPANSPFSPHRLIQMLLYILQLVLAYWLMLIVMTYNTYLTAAVVLGAGFGHWLFAVLQLRSSDGEVTDSFQTDACH
ncbi:hypothetical protein GCK72_002587 [Caenorhabditis remanei]|uniref:Copper transport protein n=1 Tax=Caenorhabditis remanei TaxID=31234 RepID=A0A6A5HVM2_CAERE|nr:hypothetical protein GCK72_002587 [Caenorhabditis remanei]KAF1770764.1 hypothetical protein GCK72_002587 [Caenorhabditis remanei]